MSVAHTLKSITRGMPRILFGGKPSVRAGEGRLAFEQLEAVTTVPLEVRSAAFQAGDPIPETYSGEGEGTSPPVNWSGVPQTAKSLALIVEDPDAPTPEPFVHWLVFNIPPEMPALPADFKGCLQGKSSLLKEGYTGPMPPKGDRPHAYHFQLFALDRMLPVREGAGRGALLKEMAGHIIGRGRLIGTYERPARD